MTTSAIGWKPLWDNDTPCDVLEGLSASTVESLTRAAADLLWNWTDRVFGLEEVVARPCRDRPPRLPSNLWGWSPLRFSSGAFPVTCGACAASRCGCREDPTSLLLPGPVHWVSEVIVDDEVLGPEEYEVAGKRNLRRLGGEGWPVFQRLDLPLGSEGTWGVTYQRGVELPTGGRLALGRLICELALAYTGGKGCQLPQRVQSITRQGVTVGIVDAFEGLEDGRTGIWLIDSWISSVTRAPKQIAGVRSVDVRRSV